MKRIYLDYAAATPMKPEVMMAMQPYFMDKFYNSSATYLSARNVRMELGEFRAQVASVLGVRPAEIIFTSGVTESNNSVISGISSQYPGSKTLISAIEHQSVISPAKDIRAKVVPVNRDGLVDLEKLKKMIDKDTVLLSIMLVNNEIGTIQPLKEIGRIISEERTKRTKQKNKFPIYLHSDLAQAANYLDLNINRLGVDLASINGGKIYGPKGSGCLYVKAGVKLKPLILGGGQEFGFRSGTENLSAIAGFSKALMLAKNGIAQEQRRIKEIRDYFEKEISRIYPTAIINGGRHRAPHICSVTLPGFDNETLMMRLDEQGIECAVGSACSALKEQTSTTLEAIGLNKELASSTLRFSFGIQTKIKDIERTILVLELLLKPSSR